VSDPEETAPFTHQPYGKGRDDNPLVSPSGPSAQPSGPDYVTPTTPPPPTVPYGSPEPGGWLGYPPGGFAPVPGTPYAGAQTHTGAKSALVLGIVALASLVLTPFCCITLPAVVCGPIAWAKGARAQREIGRQPGVYGNLSAATAGMWLGIVSTILGVLAILLLVAVALLIGLSDYSLV
jgi:hypothetical protein